METQMPTGTARSARRRQIAAIIVRWLALTTIGWLVYGLARALWTFVRLGAPLFDWQWYLVLIVLLTILVARIIRSWPRSRLTRAGSIVLLIWIGAGYPGWGQVIHLYPAQAGRVPISFWGSRGLLRLPDAVLEDLYLSGGWLYIVVGAGALEGESRGVLVEGLQRLAEQNVDVYLAVVASDYLSVPVYQEWIANVQMAATMVRDENLTNVRGIIGDAEHPKNTPLDLVGADRASFFQAADGLDGLIRWMRIEHPELDLGVTALWTLYLDRVDGDSDLSIIHRCPVDPPGGWDFVNVMTYSSFVPPSWRAYYVYLVERTMSRLYPDLQPSFLLGLTEPGRPGEPIIDFDDLLRDARLSRAMGVPEIIVFKLTERALQDHGEDFVHRLAVAVGQVPPNEVVEIPFSRPASMLVYTTLFADALLDVRGPWGWLWVAWVALNAVIVTREKGATLRSFRSESGAGRVSVNWERCDLYPFC
jgi:hypothetical protein